MLNPCPTQVAVRALVIYFYGVPDNWSLPRRLLCKELLARFLRERGERLGSRWVGFERFVLKDYRIDWNKAGPFRLVWHTPEGDTPGSAALVSQIAHFNNKDRPITPKGVMIDTTWTGKNLWDDMNATLEHGHLKPALMDFFPSGTFDFGRWGYDEMQEDAERLFLVYQREQVSSVDPKSILHTAAEEQNKARREALKRKRAPAASLHVPLSVG